MSPRIRRHLSLFPSVFLLLWFLTTAAGVVKGSSRFLQKACRGKGKKTCAPTSVPTPSPVLPTEPADTTTPATPEEPGDTTTPATPGEPEPQLVDCNAIECGSTPCQSCSCNANLGCVCEDLNCFDGKTCTDDPVCNPNGGEVCPFVFVNDRCTGGPACSTGVCDPSDPQADPTSGCVYITDDCSTNDPCNIGTCDTTFNQCTTYDPCDSNGNQCIESSVCVPDASPASSSLKANDNASSLDKLFTRQLISGYTCIETPVQCSPTSACYTSECYSGSGCQEQPKCTGEIMMPATPGYNVSYGCSASGDSHTCTAKAPGSTTAGFPFPCGVEIDVGELKSDVFKLFRLENPSSASECSMTTAGSDLTFSTVGGSSVSGVGPLTLAVPDGLAALFLIENKESATNVGPTSLLCPCGGIAW